MTLISPGDCPLQCGMCIWNHDSEFTKWQHPAMWYVALGWHAMEFTQKSAVLEFYIDFDHITAVDMSFCTSLRNFIQIGPPSAEKMTSCRFSRWRIPAILDFRGPIMGSLKSPCTTSYRSSIDTMALNCLVFEKIVFILQFGDRQTDKQTNEQKTDRQTNRWTRPSHEAAVAVASGGLTTVLKLSIHCSLRSVQWSAASDRVTICL